MFLFFVDCIKTDCSDSLWFEIASTAVNFCWFVVQFSSSKMLLQYKYFALEFVKLFFRMIFFYELLLDNTRLELIEQIEKILQLSSF